MLVLFRFCERTTRSMLQSPWSLAAVCLHHKCSLSLSRTNPNDSFLVKLAGRHVAVWILWRGVFPLLFAGLYFLVMHISAPNHNFCFTSQIFQTVTAVQLHPVCSLHLLSWLFSQYTMKTTSLHRPVCIQFIKFNLLARNFLEAFLWPHKGRFRPFCIVI